MYPATALGRTVSVCSAVMGICVIALLVNAVSNLVKMDADEENTMAFLSRRFSEREQRRLAAQLVVRFCAFARARRARERAAATAAAPGHAAAAARRVPHRVLRPFISALTAWRAYKRVINLEHRKADTTAVVAEKCGIILSALDDLQGAVAGLRKEVAEIKGKRE